MRERAEAADSPPGIRYAEAFRKLTLGA
jgi:hypothetical protein